MPTIALRMRSLGESRQTCTQPHAACPCGLTCSRRSVSPVAQPWLRRNDAWRRGLEAVPSLNALVGARTALTPEVGRTLVREAARPAACVARRHLQRTHLPRRGRAGRLASLLVLPHPLKPRLHKCEFRYHLHHNHRRTDSQVSDSAPAHSTACCSYATGGPGLDGYWWAAAADDEESSPPRSRRSRGGAGE